MTGAAAHAAVVITWPNGTVEHVRGDLAALHLNVFWPDRPGNHEMRLVWRGAPAVTGPGRAEEGP